MKSEMFEPIDPNNWKDTISGLKSWGKVPSDTPLVEEIIHSERGINLKLDDNGEHWLAEFYPWGTDGRLRARISLATEESDVPLGGFSWNDIDVITLRKWKSSTSDVKSKLISAINSNDLQTSK
jgi:hypothetical protein